MKINTYIKVEKVIDINFNDIECIYVGKPDTCMCGCAGEYYYTSINAVEAGKHRGYEVKPDEINDTKVNKLLEFFKRGEIENQDERIFTRIYNDKQYTMYLH